MPAWLLTILASEAGQKIITWLAKLLWNFASDKTKTVIADKHLKEFIKNKMAEYAAVIEEARVKGLDGYTQEEIDEITRKKIEIELALANGMPS